MEELEKIVKLRKEKCKKTGIEFDTCIVGTQELENLLEQIEKLQTEVDYWIQQNDEKAEIIEDLKIRNEELEEKLDDTIKDFDDFCWRLKNDGLYTKELDEFIENYFKFYNK